MTALDSLWARYRLPLRDALHVNGGGSRTVSYEVSYGRPFGAGKAGPLRIGAPFDLEASLKDAPDDDTSEVDGQKSLELPEGGCLWAGEGSHGSEGFFARLAPDRALVWTVFFTGSNPFTGIQLRGRAATFTTAAGVVLTVDIDDPAQPPRPDLA
ncbi:hypothetical protein [Streptomyces axinellae]|uniref:Uncharacterized protein n=1 Tax=Streptomyces axinellae TaxID=552788 RepID=A0ABN3QWA7_9ACTN